MQDVHVWWAAVQGSKLGAGVRGRVGWGRGCGRGICAYIPRASHVGLVVKNLPANAG